MKRNETKRNTLQRHGKKNKKQEAFELILRAGGALYWSEKPEWTARDKKSNAEMKNPRRGETTTTTANQHNKNYPRVLSKARCGNFMMWTYKLTRKDFHTWQCISVYITLLW